MKSKHTGLYNGLELTYQHSADIVSFLELVLATQSLLSENENTRPGSENRPVRAVAFRDKTGNLYDQMVLQDLKARELDVAQHAVKHTAIFIPVGAEQDQQLEIPIDNIYGMSMAASVSLIES